MLLEKDVDLSVQSLDTGETSLHVATGCRHMKTVKMLVEAGVDVILWIHLSAVHSDLLSRCNLLILSRLSTIFSGRRAPQ